MSQTLDREALRAEAKASLYFFASWVLKYDKLQAVPHREVCDFLQEIPPRRKLILIPRDCYKTTIAAKAFVLWVLIQDEFAGLPGCEHRILIASASSVNASKTIKSIRQQVERNDRLQWLFPEIIPDVTRTTWTDSNLLFPREGVYGEDTIESAGVDSHVVSRHYTLQVHDDLEDEKSAESPTTRQRVKNWYKSSESLFVSEQEAVHLVIGTRWGVDDMYSDIMTHERDTYVRLVRPLHWTRDLLEADAKLAASAKIPTYEMDPERYAPDSLETYYFFPELFPKASCERIRAKQGSWMYSMLYLNDPQDPALAEFRRRDLREFDFDAEGNLVLFHEDGSEELVFFDRLKRVLWWDPALTDSEQAKGSRNAMVVAAQDPQGRIFYLDAFAEKRQMGLLFSRFIGFHRRYQCGLAAIEDVGFQRALKFPLYATMREQNYNFPVREIRPFSSKEARIRGLIPFAETHRLWLRRGLLNLKEEFVQFPVCPTRDLVDAAAGCLELFGLPSIQSEASQRHQQREESARLSTRTALTGY